MSTNDLHDTCTFMAGVAVIGGVLLFCFLPAMLGTMVDNRPDLGLQILVGIGVAMLVLGWLGYRWASSRYWIRRHIRAGANQISVPKRNWWGKIVDYKTIHYSPPRR